MSTWNDVEFLQIRAYSDHPEVKKAASILDEAYFADAARRKHEALLLRDAKKLIASLWLHPSEMFRFTTKTQYFTAKHRKQVWLTPRVLKLFNLMRDIGWVNEAVAAIPPYASSKGDGKGMATIYARSLTFNRLLKRLSIKAVDVNPDLPRLQVTIEPDDLPYLSEEVTIGVDLSKVKVDEYTQWVVDTLEAQWALLKQFEFKAANGNYLPKADLYYHQSTRGKMLRGGRLYAGICTYPKKERLGITIGGEPVGSLDLSQIHPTLLLAMEGLQSEAEVMGKDAPEDAYSMPDYEDFTRSHNKVLINILFNSKSEDAASRAFLNTHCWYDEIKKELKFKTYKGRSKAKRLGKPVFSPNKKTEAVRYIEAYKQTHPVFTDVICSNLAGDLQSLDANIAVKVIDLMTQGGFPVLTVHDEFIVRRNDRKFLEIAVSAVTRQVMGLVYGSELAEVKAKWETSSRQEKILISTANIRQTIRLNNQKELQKTWLPIRLHWVYVGFVKDAAPW